VAEPLPVFRFHPDPVATGSVVPTDRACRCCGRCRGFGYALRPYTARDLPDDAPICPWCIADGSAARRLACEFVSDAEPVGDAETRRELFERTPGYLSWQGERWLTHCGRPCAYLGEPDAARFRSYAPAFIRVVAAENAFMEFWEGRQEAYEPGGSVAVYEFACLSCGTIRLGLDAE